MGEQNVSEALDEQKRRAFVKSLLDDVHALEQMLEGDTFEKNVRRIGAEQEMFLVDPSMNPAPIAPELLEKLGDERVTNELARFNLEANLTPQLYGGRCLRHMHEELEEVLEVCRDAARAVDAEVLLVGVLPTLRKSDLGLDNMTPNPRYYALNREMTRLRGGEYNFAIKGLDELETTHDNVMLESCTTSFQVHFQVEPQEFAKLYNVAQAATGPVLAAAVNSPLLLGRRLWAETRVAIFQRSIDTRSSAHQARGLRPRVSFGEAWVRESVLEIFREDIAMFRVVLASGLNEDSLADVAAGRTPKLSALRLHNGTVYRWNRACYGILDGVPHLRIENRVLPSGPTILDEVANAAFFFGLMSGVLEEHGDISACMSFDDAKNNFFAAARHGLDAQMRWVGGKAQTAASLILDHLLPLSADGLRASGIDASDIDAYLSVVRERVERGRTGAQWALGSLAAMRPKTTLDVQHRTLVASMLQNQARGRPISEWDDARVSEDDDWKRSYRTVGQFMTTEVLTVRPEDLVDLAASVMDWERIRHIPVEDDAGKLVGIVSHRAVLRLVSRGMGRGGMDKSVAIKDIMRPDPVTVRPDTPTLEAMNLMRSAAVGSLPVVENERLVGIVTERDLIALSARLLEKYLSE